MKLNADTVIIGAGRTGLTIGFYLSRAGRNVLILEKDDKTGGVIRSVSENGFLYETGPNTGVLSTPELVELFDDLSGKCTPETANEGAEKRYILKHGRWTALPSGPGSAITTPLFSLKDKFRILAEPFIKPGTDPDETVEQLVLRRLGRSYLDYAVNPFISGIYAGDPSKLVTRYALPKLYALEHNYGSFIRGSVAKAREKKTDLEKRANRKVFSVKGGLGNLTGALAAAIGKERIITGCRKTVVTIQPSGYTVSAERREDGIEIEAPVVITTVGGYALPALFLSSAMI